MDNKIFIQLKEKYQEIFNNSTNPRYFFSPGRVNIIGEHIDYTGGAVLPAALGMGTYAIVSLRNDDLIQIASLNMNDKKEFNKNDLSYKKEDSWVNYFKGMFLFLREKGCEIPGMNILIFADLPMEAGLSSSASIELLAGVIVSNLSSFNIDRLELIQVAHEVENKYIGVNCGIMDQFIIGLAKENSLLLIDCNKLRYKYVPVKNDKYVFIIGNTNKKRTLSGSEYNQRRATVEAVMRKLQTMYPVIVNLSEITPPQLEAAIDILTIEEQKRAMHIVSESQRVMETIQLFKAADFYMVGKKMNDSHDSLKNNYEVTCRELDVMVYEARKLKYVIGSRMTGAGFGGCTVSLVAKGKEDEFKNTVGAEYEKVTGIKPSFYDVEISGCADEVSADKIFIN